MKKNSVLELFIKAVFVLFVILVMYRIYIYPIGLIQEKEMPYGFSFSTEENIWMVKIFASVEIVLMLAFVLAFYLLQRTVKYFISKNYFAQKVSKNIILSGALFVALGFSSFLFKISLGLFANFGYLVSNIQGSYGNDIFMIFVGLFLIFIGKAFFEAKQLKQENDLTI